MPLSGLTNGDIVQQTVVNRKTHDDKVQREVSMDGSVTNGAHRHHTPAQGLDDIMEGRVEGP